MNSAKKAATDLDAIGEKKLNEVTAADFLTALNGGGFNAVVGLRA